MSAPSDRSQRVDDIFDAALDLPEQPASSYLNGIFKVMRAHNVTFYDAAYHALAISRGGTMLTADRRYCRKCSGSGHLASIADWRP